MAKYWVNVRGVDDFPHNATCIAVHGTLRDAEIFAFDRCCKSHRTNNIIIMIEDENYELEIVKEYEV